MRETKQFYRYAEESDDLKLARQKDASDYLEFRGEWIREELRGTGRDTFSHLYDAEVAK